MRHNCLTLKSGALYFQGVIGSMEIGSMEIMVQGS